MVRGLASVLVLMVTTSVASAQPDPRGAELFDEGRALAKAGKYAEACAKFSASLAIDPAIGTQLNYADCNEKLGHNADAWRLFDGAADAEKITNAERAKYARGRADALLPKLGVVILKLATPDAPMLAVSIGGRTVKPSPVIKEIVDPGQVSITVTAKGAAPFQVSEKIGAGNTATIDVPAFAVETTSEVVATPPPETHTVVRRKRSRVLLGYALGGGGVVALASSLVIGLKAKSDYDQQFSDGNCAKTSPPMCNQAGLRAQNDAISLANVGTGIGVAGLALVAAGVVVFLTAPTEDVVVTPTASTESAGISVVGRF